jgi:hypothetical protein
MAERQLMNLIGFLELIMSIFSLCCPNPIAAETVHSLRSTTSEGIYRIARAKKRWNSGANASSFATCCL